MMQVHGPLRWFVVAAMIAAASCSGGAGQRSFQPQAPDAQGQTAIAEDTQPVPYDSSSGDADPVLNTVVVRERTHRLVVASYSGPDREGIAFDGHGRYTSLFAIHEVHPAVQIPFPVSSNGFQPHIVAPFSSAGCIAVGTDMQAFDSQTLSNLITADNCNLGDIITETPIDSAFTQHYVRRIAGVPAYAIQIDTRAVNPGLGATWSALLYNFSTHRWNLLIRETSEVIPSPSNGYSALQAFLAPGPCPLIPRFSAGAISLYDTTEHQWKLVAPGLPGLTVGKERPRAQCFTGAGSGYRYALDHVIPYFYWQVDAVK